MKLSSDDKIDLLQAATDVTIDTEGMPSLMGISAAFDGLNQGIYLPFNHARGNLTDVQKKKLFQVLETRDSLIMYNAIHDLRVLANKAGFDYRGWFWDLMLMAHWVNEERFDYSLNTISQVYGNAPKAMAPQMSAIIDSDGWDAVPVAWMDEYSSNDSLITHLTFRKILPLWDKQFDRDLWAWEQEFIRDVMGPMMDLGIKIDLDFCMREYMRGVAAMDECTKELGFKASQSSKLQKLFIEELGLPVVKHTKSCLKCFPVDKRAQRQSVHTHEGKPSFDKDAMAEYEMLLEKSKDERASIVLRFKGWQKTTSSNYMPYLKLVDNEGVLHPGYKLHGTKTGRLSCADPNLQQIPKTSDKDWNGNLKSAFIPRDGYELWTVDYAQLQFRMTVAYAVAWAKDNGVEDPAVQALLDIFNDPMRDIFTEMASQMGWLRADVKTLVYLILFGGGGAQASLAFGVSLEQGKELVEEFHTMYPEVRKVSNDAQKQALKHGYVRYWTGRRRHFPKWSAYYRAFNAVIQGGEAEIIKRAMILIKKEVCDQNCHLILQIHDEVALEIAEGMEDKYLPRVQECMVRATEEFNEYVGVKMRFETSAKAWGEK